MHVRAIGNLAIVMLGTTLAAGGAGGWAVVSVAKAPHAWVTGRPLQLTWQVRQHGATPLHDLEPRLEAWSGHRRVSGRTWRVDDGGERGYRGSITLPAAGEWRIVVHSGFGPSRTELLPVRVIDSGTTIRGTVEDHLRRRGIPVVTAAEDGRRAFAALGCTTCHRHAAVAIRGQVDDYGPDLTNRRFNAGYLTRFLTDPSIKPPSNGRTMPNMQLREEDIAALVAFLTQPRHLTQR